MSEGGKEAVRADDEVWRPLRFVAWKSEFASWNGCSADKFGGGKVIRDGMGQGQATRADGAVDTVITNAVILDHWGVVKADIGIRDGRTLGRSRCPRRAGYRGCRLCRYRCLTSSP